MAVGGTVRGSTARWGMRFFSLPERSACCEDRPASCSMGTGALCRGSGCRGAKLITGLRLVPKLRISGPITLLPYIPL